MIIVCLCKKDRDLGSVYPKTTPTATQRILAILEEYPSASRREIPWNVWLTLLIGLLTKMELAYKTTSLKTQTSLKITARNPPVQEVGTIFAELTRCLGRKEFLPKPPNNSRTAIAVPRQILVVQRKSGSSRVFSC